MTTIYHHQTYPVEASNPAFDNRRSRCISVPNAGWKVSVRTSSHDPPMPSSSHQQQADTFIYGSYPSYYHHGHEQQRPERSSNDAFHMRKNHGRIDHQQRPASFVGGFIVPQPPLLDSSHASLVPQQQSTTQLYSVTIPSNNPAYPTTTTSHHRHHHQQSRNVSKQGSDEKQPRRIRVQSVNEMHRVWIDVAPNETGSTLAEKIHTIATFRTMKIISITSAKGRDIPLGKQPVFTSWDDLQDFQDGEEWKVKWVPLERRNIVDRIMSRVVK